MQAALTSADGGFAMSTVERPTPGMTEVLIEVAAAGINPADWKAREVPGDPSNEPGAILGWDLAGTVVELGVGVTRFAVGDRVFGMPAFPKPAGAYAQYATARSRELARVPDGVSMVQAGAIPLAGLTAWQALVDTAGVFEGARVLIHGASGGVGHLAVQVAKARGAEVWGTASAKNHELLQTLGADRLIDYRDEQFEDVASEIDIVLGLGGDPTTPDRSLKVLRPGGHYVAVGTATPSADAAAAADVTCSMMLVEPDYVSLERLAELMADGRLTVVIADQQPLSNIAALHDLGKAGSPPGKLVATMAPSA